MWFVMMNSAKCSCILGFLVSLQNLNINWWICFSVFIAKIQWKGWTRGITRKIKERGLVLRGGKKQGDELKLQENT